MSFEAELLKTKLVFNLEAGLPIIACSGSELLLQQQYSVGLSAASS